MEIEQAIKLLKEEISGLPEDNPFYEAVDIAIKAIETGEVYMTGEDYSLYLEGYKDAKKELGRFSFEWTDSNERLPQYTGLYLVSIDDLVTVANFDGAEFRNREMLVIKVDAWQSLPDPYKPSERENRK